MERCVAPEILDSLAADDPEAVRSRRDLRIINRIMGNHRWLRAQVRDRLAADGSLLEIGAGDGTFGGELVRCGLIEPERLTGIDLAPRPTSWPAAARWIRRNIFDGEPPRADVIIANLFLHHFRTDELAQLGTRIAATCDVLLCCEPARRSLHQWQARLLALFPLSRVTKHDMPVSIRAGFRGNELPQALGISNWKVSVSTTFFGAYRLAAHRI